LREERTKGVQPDDFLLTKEDLIGPDPALVMEESKAYKKLHSMIGLRSVKQAVTSMLEMLKTNYQRELRELAPHQVCSYSSGSLKQLLMTCCKDLA
jgi:hypothetical protein